MDGEPSPRIYRAMLENNGMPRLGSSATTLGVRQNKDIEVDQAGLVHRPAFLPNEKNGLSCARSIASLPPFALPIAWGGKNARTAVWQIEEINLGAELLAGDDAAPGSQHVSVGPSHTMPYDNYVQTIEATRPKWKKVVRN